MAAAVHRPFHALAIDPEEVPSSDVCAAALVAAAKVTGEDARRFSEAYAPRRFVFIAYEALSQFYPLYPGNRLARALGLGATYAGTMRTAKGSRWWTGGLGATAVAQACAALEACG